MILGCCLLYLLIGSLEMGSNHVREYNNLLRVSVGTYNLI